MEKTKTIGYLPDETPPVWKLLLYGLQQVIVMFPATVTVALITGFQVSTTIFASGLATLVFLLVTGRKIPLYYGSSFAYLSAVSGLMATDAIKAKITDPAAAEQLQKWLEKGANEIRILPGDAISYAQFGIIMSGFISIFAGLLVRFAGRDVVEKILPPTITGPIAMVIGLTLFGNAMKDAAPGENQSNLVWIVSLVTLLSTVVFTRYLKGFLGQLPLLLGVGMGCLAAAVLYFGFGINLFRDINPELMNSPFTLGVFSVPAITFPKLSWEAVVAIMPIAIATIPESTAHIYQLDVYVNDLAEKKQSGKKYDLAKYLDRNLIGDGIGDMVSGLVGGPAGTNYGENISTMAITRVFSVSVLIVAAVIAILISFFTPLVQGIYAIPLSVIGGLEIYLFGAIAAQGVAIMIDKKVDMFDPKNIAVIATVMVIAVGGQYAFGGNIPFFGANIPCVAGAAVFGILLNAFLSIGQKRDKADPVAEDVTA